MMAAGCSVLGISGKRDYPLIPMQSYQNANHDEFNVRGYVMGVSICPAFSMCIRANGLDLTTDPTLIDNSDYEKSRKAFQSGQIISIYGRKLILRRFEMGHEYIVSVKTGRGIVGATKVK